LSKPLKGSNILPKWILSSYPQRTHTPHAEGEEDRINIYLITHTYTQNESSSETDQLCLLAVRAPAERPQNMPITPHESIAGHLFSYNRHERHCGGVVALASVTRAALACARCPAQLTSFCPAPSKHLGKPANCSPGREAQRGGAPGPACLQGSPVRCGCARCRQARPAAVVRARTHTSTRAQRCLRSAHTQLAQLPYPPAPPPTRPPFVTCDLSFQRSFGQLKIVNRPTPQSSALFSGPHGLSGSLGTS
jgi:hypothetical protein